MFVYVYISFSRRFINKESFFTFEHIAITFDEVICFHFLKCDGQTITLSIAPDLNELSILYISESRKRSMTNSRNSYAIFNLHEIII